MSKVNQSEFKYLIILEGVLALLSGATAAVAGAPAILLFTGPVLLFFVVDLIHYLWERPT